MTGPVRPGGSTGRGVVGVGLTRRVVYKQPPSIDDWVFWWHVNKDEFLSREALSLPANSQSREVFLGRRTQADPALRTDGIINALIGRMTDRYPYVRADACVALGRAAAGTRFSQRATGILLGRMGDPDHEVHEAAIIGMGLLGDRKCLPWLLAILEDDDETKKLMRGKRPCFCLRSLAAYAIGMIGGDTTVRDALLQASADDGNQSVRTTATLALGLLPGDRMFLAPAYTRLEEVATDTSLAAVQRAHAVVALARLISRNNLAAGAGMIDRFVRLMRDDSSLHVRCSAIIGLGITLQGRDHAEPVAALVSILERGKSAGERNLAAIALGRAGGETAWKTLVRHARRGNDQRTAYSALGLGILCRYAAEGATADQDSPAAEHRASGLKALRHCLEKKNAPDVRGAVAIALGIANDADAAKLLSRRFAKSRNAEVRQFLALALGMIRHGGASKRLADALASPKRRDKVVKANAGHALALVGGPDPVGELFELYGDPMFARELTAISEALAGGARPRSLAKLRGVVADFKRPAFARGAGCLALGALGDLRAVHPRSAINRDSNFLATYHTLNVINFHVY